MALKNIVKPITLSILDSATLSLVNATPFPALTNACFRIKIINASNILVWISYDSVNLHDAVPVEQSLELNTQQCSSPTNNVAWMSKGTVIYLFGDPTTAVGNIYLCGHYQET